MECLLDETLRRGMGGLIRLFVLCISEVYEYKATVRLDSAFIEPSEG